MSGQAKRSRVRAAIRHREQVARLIAAACWPIPAAKACIMCKGSGKMPDPLGRVRPGDCQRCHGSGREIDVAVRSLLAVDTGFDVSVARAFGERLITEGQRDNDTWAVFVDWCRAQGMGPELPGVRHSQIDAALARGGKTAMLAESVREAVARGESVRVMAPGHVVDGATWLTEKGLTEPTKRGWPGHLPAEWARGPGRVTCNTCAGSGTMEDWPGLLRVPCSDCGEIGLVDGPRPQPGDAKVRMGKRLLAALDGQPSECQVPQFPGGHQHNNCSCRGTGHNLAGVLPPLEWSSVVRRGVADGWDASRQREAPAWQDVFGQGVEFPRDTRSMPRGEHRVPGDNELRYGPGNAWAGFFASQDIGVESDEDFVARRARWDRATARLPRWRRGELRHERQRAVRRSSTAAAGADDAFMAMLGDMQAQQDDRRDAAPDWMAPPPRPDETTEQYRQRLLHAVNAIPGVTATAVAENNGRVDITATFTEPPTVTIVVD